MGPSLAPHQGVRRHDRHPLTTRACGGSSTR
jgi:hypothetical protein